MASAKPLFRQRNSAPSLRSFPTSLHRYRRVRVVDKLLPGPVAASPANCNCRPGFTAAMILKDVKLARAAAQNAESSTPLGAEATALYSLFAASGESGRDFSGIINMIRGKAGG